MSNEKILCQAKHSPTGGCTLCHGSGVLLEKLKCDSCHHEFWMRPNTGSTMYNGKQFRTFDGVEITWDRIASTCNFCPVKP